MRNKVKAVLTKILGEDTMEDHTIVIRLMNACAYVFAHPDKLNESDTELLRKAYVQVEEKGYL